MSALLLAALLGACGLSAGERATARLAFEPERAALGEPVRLVCEIEHAAAQPLALGAIEPEPDGSWVLLGRERLSSRAAEPGRRAVALAWRVASLEPGPRRAPEAFRQALEEAGVVLLGLEPVLEVEGLLAADEDEPRGLRGFPSSLVPEEARGGAELSWAPVAPLALLVAGALLFAARRRPRRGAPAPDHAWRLEELRRAAGEPARAREAVFGLSRLVRAAVDERDGPSRAGLTDEEWLAAVRREERLPGAAEEELAALLARLAEVKYAGARPTSWALDECFAAARGLLSGLGAAPASPTPPARTRRGRQEVGA